MRERIGVRVLGLSQGTADEFVGDGLDGVVDDDL
jgi:hypothetical protein